MTHLSRLFALRIFRSPVAPELWDETSLASAVKLNGVPIDPAAAAPAPNTTGVLAAPAPEPKLKTGAAGVDGICSPGSPVVAAGAVPADDGGISDG